MDVTAAACEKLSSAQHRRVLTQAAVDNSDLERGFSVSEDSLPSDYLFITKQGKPYTKESFKSLWRVVRKKLGLKLREITFHDMRAKAASDEVSDKSAKELLHHQDVKITRRVYRRKVPVATPLPSAIGGRERG